MSTTAIGNLKPHVAQMRTRYDLDELAALTLQVYTRDLNGWQPILAAPNGSANSYFIVSGHRRQMARLLAFALADWAAEHTETEIEVEVVRTMLAALVESLGSLEKVIESLLVKYGQREIAFVPFEGGEKAQILALQNANYGGEQPDALGIAHSFRQAIAAGATEMEIAQNVGQSGHYVRSHLALAKIPAELAERIAAGELPLSVATAVAELPEPKRTGLAIFILANEPGKVTAKAIKECAAALKKWLGLQMPLLVKHQSQRNIARALVRLWGQVVEAYPDDAYAAAAMLITRDVHAEPWSAQEKLTLWFQALGGDTYFKDGRINWSAVVDYLVTEVACESCPIAQLPQQPLRSDLSQGQGGPLGMPCRVGQAAARCMHGLAENDSFDVRVPWAWSQHPGVVGEGGDYRVKSYDDLLTAWQAQAAKEGAEDTAAEDTAAEDTAAEAKAAAATADDDPAKAEEPGKSGQGKRPVSAGSEQADDSSRPTPPAKDSPIVKQRAQIADFMKRHETLAANHPLATSCGQCRHHLDGSPTQDESVPHCAWAGRLRSVSFKALQPEGDVKAPPIPVCRQFAPSQPWDELVPAHPEPPGLPRSWLRAQILHLVKDGNRQGSGRNCFEFLTGRPMSANENSGDWFEKQLDTQGGELSDAQLFTLFIWAHTEWRRARGSQFTLPVNGSGMQFGQYRERPWPVKEAAT